MAQGHLQGNGRWVHLTAIGGTGMGALAVLLQRFGWKVTGSDHPLYPPMSTYLDTNKVLRKESFAANHLSGKTWGFASEKPDLVIVGNAVSRPNVEARQVEEWVLDGSVWRMSFAQALAEFGIQDRQSLVVAGTHGKTTTTSIAAHLLQELGHEPGFFIGGLPQNFSEGGCRLGQGSVFVSEGDEYDTAYWDKVSKFLHYRPSVTLVTGIEYDHADIYANVHDIEASFVRLVGITKEALVLVHPKSSPRPKSMEVLIAAAASKGLRHVSYGDAADAHVRLHSVESAVVPGMQALGSRLRVSVGPANPVELLSPMSGHHNALNVVGVLAMLLESKRLSSIEEARAPLLSFRGVKRRQEEVFVSSSLVVLDDFAHHPTAIQETIRAIRMRYPNHAVCSFFEARSATASRKTLFEDFVSCFDGSSAVFLSPPSKTNIPEAEKLNVDDLARRLNSRKELQGAPIFVERELKPLVESFAQYRSKTKEPIVALVMSNGPFGGIHAMLSGH